MVLNKIPSVHVEVYDEFVDCQIIHHMHIKFKWKIMIIRDRIVSVKSICVKWSNLFEHGRQI